MEPTAEHLSPAVRAARDELADLIAWIDSNGKQLGFDGNLRNMTAAGCFDQVLEHQAALLVLVDNQLNGSAMALMRIMAEGVIRGLWFQNCTTDAELQRFKDHDTIDKGIRTLSSEVEAKLGNVQDVMSQVIKSDWPLLCSFTHTGFKQVVRRFTGGSLMKPSYPDHDVVLALRFAGGMGLLSMLGLAALSSNLQLMQAILARVHQFAPDAGAIR
jgi:hypothetical protein